VRIVSLFLALSFFPACASPVSEEPIVLWEGYRYDWEELSHRIAYLRSSVGAPDAAGVFPAELGIIGGNFSTGGFGADVPMWTMTWLEVDSQHVQVAQGTLPFAIGPTGRAELQGELDLAALGMEDWPVVTVALRGVTFDTDVPPEPGADPDYDVSHGWTPQRLGAGVGDMSRTGDLVSFDAWMEFKAGPLDRPPMNASVPYANVAGALDVSIVGARRGSVITSGRLEASDYILRDPPYTDIVPLPEAERTLVMAGEPSLPLGIPLIRSWGMVLNSSIGEEGRYLRAFGVQLEAFGYGQDSGEATMVFDLFCSHSSLVEEGDLEVEYLVDVDLLQVNDPEGSAQLASAQAASEVGPLELTLP